MSIQFQSASPRITKVTKNLIAEEGSTVILICQAQGDPQPRVMWYRQTSVISTTEQVTLKVHMKSAGLYLCKIKNIYGTDQATVNIMIKGSKSLLFRIMTYIMT